MAGAIIVFVAKIGKTGVSPSGLGFYCLMDAFRNYAGR